MGWSTRRAVTLVVAVFGAVLVAVLVTMPAASALSANHGASFAVRCPFTRDPPHRLSDDPIVYPDDPGAAHSHDFFGNVTTDAYSTYGDGTEHDLLGKGTTCLRTGDTAAYWMPTVSWKDQQGTHVLTSNRAVFYYRAGGKDHRKVKPFPGGLKVITDDAGHISWRCAEKGKGSRNPPKQCDTEKLGVRIIFPDCVAVASDGEPRLDSDNHRSHMAYSSVRDSKVRCPRSHPRSVPVLTMNVIFPIPNTQGEVTLSSDEPGDPGGSTMHADFFNAWDQPTLEHLVTRCINSVSPSKPRPDECRA